MDAWVPAVRRPCFAVEDDGLASIAARNGFHGAASAVVPRRRSSIRNLASLTSPTAAHCSSPRSGRIFDNRFEEINSSSHFLDACNLCKKPLGGNRDIFMYRGDIPFCSEECRSEQIEEDEAREKSLSLSAMKARRSKNKDSTSAQQNGTASSNKSQKYPFRAGTVAAA